MKKKYKYWIAGVFLALTVPATLSAQSFSQNVICSAGTFTASTSGSMAWSIGETMVMTYASTNNFFTQGFEQPDSVAMIATGIVDASNETISVYPNPVIDDLIIHISGGTGIYSVEVYDLQGKLLKKESIESSLDKRVNISFAELTSGMYLVNIIHSKTGFKNSYKITKLN